jgi:hypothetical protein
MESPTPGFVGQIKGRLTTKRYQAATVFVDHYSQLTFAYMQFSTGAEETINAKLPFGFESVSLNKRDRGHVGHIHFEIRRKARTTQGCFEQKSFWLNYLGTT